MGTRIAIATFDAQVNTSFVWKTHSPPRGEWKWDAHLKCKYTKEDES